MDRELDENKEENKDSDSLLVHSGKMSVQEVLHVVGDIFKCVGWQVSTFVQAPWVWNGRSVLLSKPLGCGMVGQYLCLSP